MAKKSKTKSKTKGKVVKKQTKQISLSTWIWLIALAVLVGIIVWFSSLGLFTKVTVEEKVVGPYVLVGYDHVGDYAKVGPVFLKVYQDLKKDQIVTALGMGVYYDNPQVTAKDKLRSTLGSLLEAKDFRRLPYLREKYVVKQYDVRKALVVNFPTKSAAAYMIGPMKAYPAIMTHANYKKYKLNQAIEVYDMPHGQTQYIMEIVQ